MRLLGTISVVSILISVLISIPGGVAQAGRLPEKITLSEIVSTLLDDPVTHESDRRGLAIFHGEWDRIEDPTPSEQAAIALQRFDLTNPIFSHEQAPPLLCAQAALLRGDVHQALRWVQGDLSVQGGLIQARCYELLGRLDDAITVLEPWRQRLGKDPIEDAARLTAMAQGLVLLARLEGRPGQDYQTAVSLYGKAHGALDRLYWPALLAEAELLLDKDNASQATDALIECLRLNPKCGPAWFELGSLAARNYQFDIALRCTKELRDVNATHPLADQLEAEISLIQKDPSWGLRVIEPALGRYPNHPQLLGQLAGCRALLYDEAGLRKTFEKIETLFPRYPGVYQTVGRVLSLARQYPQAESMLRQAIERSPNWPRPRVELGLLLMQSGDEPEALVELQRAVTLDPFNRRARNQLKLAQQLRGYEQIRTEHFIIKYRRGIDEALARDMPEQLERIYRRVTGVYGYHPPRSTLIEIFPDEQSFGVRITGVPDIWTIAACTGDVIALTPPREGPGQRGPFDWPRVIGHEFVHTVTLNMTDYRIPHWLTEACAVWLEPGDRTYEECQMLAWALGSDRLFDLDQINWAFIRPRGPRDRPLAYAQSSWMVQYMTERFGHNAVIKLLEHYRQSPHDHKGIRIATGLEPERFIVEFKEWAGRQVREWGLHQQPDDPRIEAFLSEVENTGSIDVQRLGQLIEVNPQHPELLKIAAREAIESEDLSRARAAIQRYAGARPVDRWADRELIRLATREGRAELAIPSYERLDAQDTDSGIWGYRLAKIYRSGDRLDLAAEAIERALHRDPYRAQYRELAATLSLQRGDTEVATRHLIALSILEPDRSIHRTRLAAFYFRLGKVVDADAHAREALKLDPDAPVRKFLLPDEDAGTGYDNLREES